MVCSLAQDRDPADATDIAGSVFLFRFVPLASWAASGRLEIMLDLKLAEGASLKATEAEVKRLGGLAGRS